MYEFVVINRRKKWPVLLYSVICALVGLAFIIFNKTALNIFGIILGGLILILGISVVVVFLSREGAKSTFSLAAGIVLILAGIIVLLKNNAVVNFAGYIFAAYVLVHGCIMIYLAYEDKKANVVNWKVTLSFGIALAVAAVLMFLFLDKLKAATAVVVGIMLIINAVLDIVSVFIK